MSKYIFLQYAFSGHTLSESSELQNLTVLLYNAQYVLLSGYGVALQNECNDVFHSYNPIIENINTNTIVNIATPVNYTFT